MNQISIDNWSFKCFYKITTSILLACSVISTSKQFFGNPIQCDIVSSNTKWDMTKKPDDSLEGAWMAVSWTVTVGCTQPSTSLPTSRAPVLSVNMMETPCTTPTISGWLYSLSYRCVGCVMGMTTHVTSSCIGSTLLPTKDALAQHGGRSHEVSGTQCPG